MCLRFCSQYTVCDFAPDAIWNSLFFLTMKDFSLKVVSSEMDRDKMVSIESPLKLRCQLEQELAILQRITNPFRKIRCAEEKCMCGCLYTNMFDTYFCFGISIAPQIQAASSNGGKNPLCNCQLLTMTYTFLSFTRAFKYYLNDFTPQLLTAVRAQERTRTEIQYGLAVL